MPASKGRLVADVTGEVETEEGVLVIRRIHVQYTLQVAVEQRETAERVHGFYARACPVYRSIGECIDITTEVAMVDLP